MSALIEGVRRWQIRAVGRNLNEMESPHCLSDHLVLTDQSSKAVLQTHRNKLNIDSS